MNDDTKVDLPSTEEDDVDIFALLDKSIEDKDDEQKNLIDPNDTINLSNQDKKEIQLLPSKKIIFNAFELFFTIISLCILNNPRLSCALVVVFLVVIVLSVNLSMSNAPDISHLIEHDYSDVKSKYDLSVGQINHWCLDGSNDQCTCEDPLTPVKKLAPIWLHAFDKNIADIETAVEKWGEDPGNLDVVFLGENIVEYWAGRSIGSITSTFTKKVEEKFQSVFGKDGKFKVLPLGLAGDMVPNLLWRIQNGEIPANLHPKVWWLVLGVNDLSMRQCSEEVVLLGILRIIEEILDKRPDAIIVINSVLPMSSDVQGRVPKISWQDVKKVSTKGTGGDGRRMAKKTKKDDNDEPGNEAQLTSMTGEMKPAKMKNIPAIKVRNGLKTVKVSMWPSVEALNKALKRFTWSRKHVYFFDASDIFIEADDEHSTPKIIKDLVLSFKTGQPSVAGHGELLKGIKQKIKEVLHKKGAWIKKMNQKKSEGKKGEKEKKEGNAKNETTIDNEKPKVWKKSKGEKGEKETKDSEKPKVLKNGKGEKGEKETKDSEKPKVGKNGKGEKGEKNPMGTLKTTKDNEKVLSEKKSKGEKGG